MANMAKLHQLNQLLNRDWTNLIWSEVALTLHLTAFKIDPMHFWTIFYFIKLTCLLYAARKLTAKQLFDMLYLG